MTRLIELDPPHIRDMVNERFDHEILGDVVLPVNDEGGYSDEEEAGGDGPGL
jgi:hypothetical protein